MKYEAMYYVQFCRLEHTHVTIAADDAHIEVTHPRGCLSLRTTRRVVARGKACWDGRRSKSLYSMEIIYCPWQSA